MIFIDRSIPKPVAEALQKVRDDVEWLEPRFHHNAKDYEWLREAGTNGWLCISRDKHIRTRPGERRALIDHRVGLFLLLQKQPPRRWDYLKLIVSTLDNMEELFEQTDRPFIYGISRIGEIRRVPLD
jgi:predicted nuclease of predicted toxin-antitoxin system